MDKKDVPDQPDDDDRISQLHARLERAQEAEQARTARSSQAADPNYRLGNRVLADLIAGIGGGALIGWFVDQLFNTSPWALLGLLFLGTIVAFRNIIRLGSAPPPTEQQGKD